MDLPLLDVWKESWTESVQAHTDVTGDGATVAHTLDQDAILPQYNIS